MENTRILVVDNEKRMCLVLKAALEADHYTVGIAYDGKAAIEAFQKEPYELVIVDLKMPGMDGISVLEKIKEANSSTEVILMTAYATAQTAVEAMKKGAYDYLVKPFEMDELKLKVEHILEKKRLSEENINLRQELKNKFSLENVIGQSEAMQKVYRMVDKVVKSDATVLLLGESGTGKELVARAIHELGSNADQPFIAVNCGALPESLLESELFGYEKGAFTGADKQKLGRFELAGNGTIFLDEIGDISLTTQVKLLRVLQAHEIVRVGGTETIAVKARILAATNVNLEEAKQSGTFREDLYYRINVFPILLPPLRERRDDIPDLVAHFLEKHGNSKVQIEPEALAVLMKYQYPGNVRELENIIERALIMSGGGVLRTDDFPIHITSGVDVIPGGEIPAQELHLEIVEKNLIIKALYKSHGNKTEAAKLLGVTRRKLYSMMERHAINPDSIKTP